MCIYGCWCFGYLNDTERQDAIVGMDMALNDNGFLIFFESITKDNEQIEVREHEWQEQQLYVRT